jgi:hypothetical protein
MLTLRTLRATRLIQPWCDRILLACGLVALCAPLCLAVDAAYRNDHTILYPSVARGRLPAGRGMHGPRLPATAGRSEGWSHARCPRCP